MVTTKRGRKTAASILLVSAFLVLGGSLLTLPEALTSGGNSGATPRAMVAQFDQNLGMLIQGDVREVCFTVLNAGRRRLVITGENRGCCGQSAVASSFVAPPGDTIELRAQVDTSGWCGQLRQEFSYNTNDPQCPRLTFTVCGEVVTSNSSSLVR